MRDLDQSLPSVVVVVYFGSKIVECLQDRISWAHASHSLLLCIEPLRGCNQSLARAARLKISGLVGLSPLSQKQSPRGYLDYDCNYHVSPTAPPTQITSRSNIHVSRVYYQSQFAAILAISPSVPLTTRACHLQRFSYPILGCTTLRHLCLVSVCCED